MTSGSPSCTTSPGPTLTADTVPVGRGDDPYKQLWTSDPDGDPISQRANLPDDLPPDELTMAKATDPVFPPPWDHMVYPLYLYLLDWQL